MSGLAAGVEWPYFNPVRIHFGTGVFRRRIRDAVGRRHVLIVTTSGFVRRGLIRQLEDRLESIAMVVGNVPPNPQVSYLERLVRDVQQDQSVEVILGVGGGSVLDTAKVLGVLGKHEFDTKVQLPDLIRGKTDPSLPGIPVITVPTTAGTGSEVTPFAAVWDALSGKKYSVDHAFVYPERALVDPELTMTLSAEQTSISALDAISQAFEALWNKNATPITSLYAIEALKIALPTLSLLVRELSSAELRTRMMQASLLAGLAISQTRTAIAHSISYPLTVHLGVPHGLACSFALPALLRYNAEVDDGRLAYAAKVLGHASVTSLAQGVANLLGELDATRRTQSYVGSVEQCKDLVVEMNTPERMRNSLREPSESDLVGILEESLGV